MGRRSCNRSRICALLIGVCLWAAPAAWGAVSPQRIVMAIDPDQTSALVGNVPAASRRAVDLGLVPAETPLDELTLRFSMTAAQQTALTQLLSDQQNPASSRYRKWLTPEQFGAQFGLAPADMQKVSGWLTSQGFAVTQVARGAMFIRFTGTAAQVERSFHTSIHTVTVDGETHITNLSDPRLPSAIALVTSAITGLHDFRLKPHYHEWIMPSTGGPEDAAGASVQSTSPLYTSAASGNHFVAPGDFYTIYDEKPTLTSGVDGTGITIAIVGQTDITLADIATFRSLSGLSVNAPTVQLYGIDPGVSSKDTVEAMLDVEWSGASAPEAKILYVNSKDVLGTSLVQAIDNNLAPIISMSYGLCESNANGNGPTVLTMYSQLAQMANAQGQTIVVASGDAGATDCDVMVGSATQGLAVDFPAALPNVTGVGGTMFDEGGGTYWGPNNGTSATALSYTPETAWNEDSATNLASGGGGSSIFFTKPEWQVGVGVPADSSRDVPDISFNAAASHDGYLICTIGYCVDGWRNAAGLHDVAGGTSVGTPIFAGVLALVEQKIGNRVGNANPIIYALANSSFYSSVFHDITSGSNSSPCTAGSTDCPAGGVIGYSAGVGYDRATGWGTLDVFNLVNSWGLVTPIVTSLGQNASTTTLTGTPTASVVQGTNIALTASVVSGTVTTSAVPTGTVQFLVDSVAVGSPVALVAGNASFTLDTRPVASGAHTIFAAYSGDQIFAASKAFLAATIVSSGVPDFAVAPATSSVTVTAGSTAPGILVTVTGLNSFTGTVQLTATASGNFQFSLSPTSVTLSNTKTVGTSILTLQALRGSAKGGAIASTRPVPGLWHAYGAGSGIALAGLLMMILPKKRRYMGVLVALLSVGMLAAAGCGSGTNLAPSVAPVIPTSAGSYTVTVTAAGTSGTTAVTHSFMVSFIVQ